MFTVEIKTGNEAFEHAEAECARILRAIADKLDRLDGRSNLESGPCMDFNGNKVGTWSLAIS